MEKFSNAYIECEMKDWNDLFLINQDFLSKFVYRGQADSQWELATSIERFVNKIHSSGIDHVMPELYEQKTLEEFKWKYPVYALDEHIPIESEEIEWLTIMQHYGAPTRLLDFTFSPFVALFMALDNSFADFSSIWCVNQKIVNHYIEKKYMQDNNTNYTIEREINKYKYEYANKLINKGGFIRNREKGVLLVSPQIANRRINAQQGLFAIPTNIEISFKDNLSIFYDVQNLITIDLSELIKYSNNSSGTHSQSDIILLKINIPFKLRYQLTKMLKLINITHETMYPGIEGLAKSMARIRFKDLKYKD